MAETETRPQTERQDEELPGLRQPPRTSALNDVVQRNLAVRARRQEAAVRDPEKSGDTPPEWGRSAAPKTVVVIDDEPDNVELTVMVLESAGHTVHGATAGQAGVDLAVDHSADVVVLDHLMPGMTGAEVGGALRAHPVTQDIKILMHSATPEAMIRASFTGYNAYLAKPAQGLRLLQEIEAL